MAFLPKNFRQFLLQGAFLTIVNLSLHLSLKNLLNIFIMKAVCYSLYYAIKYGFEIDELNFDTAKRSNHCLFLLFTYLYYVKKKNRSAIKLCKDFARLLQKTEMNIFWLFIYEALPQSDLHDYWKAMKTNGVTFLVDI